MRSKQKRLLAIALLSGLATGFHSAYAGDVTAGKAKAGLCATCHGSDGISTMPLVPNLAGQKPAYLAKSLHAYKDGSRKDAMMSSIVSTLSDEDIENLAAYFASLGK